MATITSADLNRLKEEGTLWLSTDMNDSDYKNWADLIDADVARWRKAGIKAFRTLLMYEGRPYAEEDVFNGDCPDNDIFNSILVYLGYKRLTNGKWSK